jgi:hypothetical protein
MRINTEHPSPIDCHTLFTRRKNKGYVEQEITVTVNERYSKWEITATFIRELTFAAVVIHVEVLARGGHKPELYNCRWSRS